MIHIWLYFIQFLSLPHMNDEHSFQYSDFSQCFESQKNHYVTPQLKYSKINVFEFQ